MLVLYKISFLRTNRLIWFWIFFFKNNLFKSLQTTLSYTHDGISVIKIKPNSNWEGTVPKYFLWLYMHYMNVFHNHKTKQKVSQKHVYITWFYLNVCSILKCYKVKKKPIWIFALHILYALNVRIYNFPVEGG